MDALRFEAAEAVLSFYPVELIMVGVADNRHDTNIRYLDKCSEVIYKPSTDII